MSARARCTSFAATAAIAIACAKSPPPTAPETDLVIPPMPPAKPQPSMPPVVRRPPEPVLVEPSEPPPSPTGMAPPSPLALPCTTDAQCMTHRCNQQYGKCAFPCQSDLDCVPGATCFVQGGAPMAVCLPKPP